MSNCALPLAERLLVLEEAVGRLAAQMATVIGGAAEVTDALPSKAEKASRHKERKEHREQKGQREDGSESGGVSHVDQELVGGECGCGDVDGCDD